MSVDYREREKLLGLGISVLLENVVVNVKRELVRNILALSFEFTEPIQLEEWTKGKSYSICLNAPLNNFSAIIFQS